MARFVLLPCHLREAKFVPQKGAEELELDWSELCERLAPSGSVDAKLALRRAEPRAFIGLTKDIADPRVVRNFFFMNPDRSARLEWLLDRDSSFKDRLLEVYRVEEVDWEEVQVEEFDTPGRPPWEIPRAQGGTK